MKKKHFTQAELNELFDLLYRLEDFLEGTTNEAAVTECIRLLNKEGFR